MKLKPPPEPLRLNLKYAGCTAFKLDPFNARKHSQRQLAMLGAAIKAFGFTNPVLVDETFTVIAGAARLQAAMAIGLQEIPFIQLDHLSAVQKKALAISDNKLGDLSQFDPERLSETLRELTKLDFRIELTGFLTAEADVLIEPPMIGGPAAARADPVDRFELPDPATTRAVSRKGDLWLLESHRILCGDALSREDYQRVLEGARAQMVFTDPPYNVRVHGHVSGLGRTQHREFPMASGEMSKEQFTRFLLDFMRHCADHSVEGSIHYVFMDWRHLPEVLAAGEQAYDEFKNLVVWNKTNASMGSLYRSKHELVLVFKHGTGPHINNVELGRHGRYRTTVWDYPGVNTFRAGREEDIAAHPTPKPVGLVADAMRDCSKRNGLVLDPFGGSGATLLAAERTGRRAALIELDPLYVDVAVERWQRLTGKAAVLAGDARRFAEVADARRDDAAPVGEVAHV